GFDGGLLGSKAFLDHDPFDVLHHHDGVVNQHANRQHKAEHGEDIQVEARHRHDGKGPHGGTRLGPTISSLLATAHADMVVFGRHRLKLLLDAVNETTSIIAAVNAQSMVLETMAAEHVLRVVLNPGIQAPLYVTAGGKALQIGRASCRELV